MAGERSPKKSNPKRPGPKKLTAKHKAALAKGREMSGVVDRYLTALNVPKRRGRKVSTAVLRQRLADAEATVRSANGLNIVLKAQEVRDLRARLKERAADGSDLRALEMAFVKVAKQFSVNRKISYEAWRDAGVFPAVLKRAGITRTGSDSKLKSK